MDEEYGPIGPAMPTGDIDFSSMYKLDTKPSVVDDIKIKDERKEKDENRRKHRSRSRSRERSRRDRDRKRDDKRERSRDRDRHRDRSDRRERDGRDTKRTDSPTPAMPMGPLVSNFPKKSSRRKKPSLYWDIPPPGFEHVSNPTT